MATRWDQLAEDGNRRVWDRAVSPVARELLAEATRLTQAMVAQMRIALPEVMPDAETLAENAASTEQTIKVLARGLADGADPQQLELPSATVAFAQAGVHRQVPPTQLVRAYRLGHEQVWQWCFERIALHCSSVGALRNATELFTRWTFVYADAAITRVEEAVETERETWLRSAMAARGAAIAAILSGEERNEDRASSRLRYVLARDHIGLAASVPTGIDGDPQEMLTHAVVRLAEKAGAEAHLIYPTGVTTCSAWISRGHDFTEQDVAALAKCPLASVKIGVGEPGRGIEGFRRTHIEAGHARRVAADANLSGPVLYLDHAVAAMATVDYHLAATFVHRILGPLAGTDDVARRAAEALTVYLDENRSRTKAAARLHVHPNTVTYRVHQAEHILGHRLHNISSLDLRVALALLPSLLGTPGSANTSPS
ncbi:MAG: helix-turn-helix domain-containing protein [Mycobacterium sp.]